MKILFYICQLLLLITSYKLNSFIVCDSYCYIQMKMEGETKRQLPKGTISLDLPTTTVAS